MKRNRIWKTLTMVLLLLTLTTGLCIAKFIEDDDGNWVQYYYQDDWNIFYIDTNAVKAREFEGKKYLDVSIRRKWKHVEQLILVNRWVESTNAKWHMLIDIENHKSIALEFANEHNNPKRGTTDISFVTTHAEALLPFEENLLAWVERNRPDVIKEIHTFNGNNTPSAGTQTVTANGVGNVMTSAGTQTGDLNAEAAQIQQWLQDGKTSAYNAGIGFEWWDEKAKADFEALPFSNDIAEVCSHVYRFSHYSDGSVVTYVVLVPRHVRISYGGGEYETFDSLVIANIARKNYDPVDHQMIFEPLDGAWESAYIKEGRTQSIVYLPGDDTPPLDWKWLENGQEEIEQKGGTVNLLGSEFFYTFEGTNNPNSFILHGYYDFDWPDKESQRGSFEVLPGITLPTKSGNYEE